jgi:hypothetical protein
LGRLGTLAERTKNRTSVLMPFSRAPAEVEVGLLRRLIRQIASANPHPTRLQQRCGVGFSHLDGAVGRDGTAGAGEELHGADAGRARRRTGGPDSIWLRPSSGARSFIN